MNSTATASSSSSTGGATAPNGISRTRSVRTGTPVSARAAVRKPAPASSSSSSAVSAADAAAEADAKAEMQARIDELQERLQQVELAHGEAQKQAAVLQVKLDEARHEQGLLEESVHEHTERINDLEGEKKESLRARREMEQIYESERAAALREKEEAATREEELQSALQRMKETLAQREMRAGLDDERKPHLSRQSSTYARSSNPSPNPEAFDRQFAPPSVERSDSSSRSSSKLVLQKDKLIESLRLELAEAQIKLVEMENMGGGRMQELQRQMYEIKMQNARLMEENESFQLLLSEKTLNGDFLRPPSTSGSRPPSRPDDSAVPVGTTLADELDSQEDGEGGEEVRRLQAEVNGMKDQNKALTLYINNIISRLLQHEQFEQILDKTPDLMAGPGAASRRYAESGVDKEKDLPPPPPEKDGQSGEDGATGFLQRARSVMGGTRPKRPQSQIIGSDYKPLPIPGRTGDEPVRLTENPQTAPSVPLGRSTSVRGPGGHGHGHRRANSEWPAASLVTNMYRGGAGPAISPLSPGLSSPTRGNSFFGPQAAAAAAAARAASGSTTVTTISETIDGTGKENGAPQQQRDSKLSDDAASRRISGEVDGTAPHPPLHPHPPASPPHSTTSSNLDRGDASKPGSGAIMMGSRMRPLRLVQENGGIADADEAAARKAANRGSWFGWMNKGLPIPGLPGSSGNSTNASAAAAPTSSAVGSPPPPPAPGSGLVRSTTEPSAPQ